MAFFEIDGDWHGTLRGVGPPPSILADEYHLGFIYTDEDTGIVYVSTTSGWVVNNCSTGTPVLYANLPSGVAGMYASISDASGTPTWHGVASGTGTASSSTTYPVFSNGTSWIYT